MFKFQIPKFKNKWFKIRIKEIIQIIPIYSNQDQIDELQIQTNNRGLWCIKPNQSTHDDWISQYRLNIWHHYLQISMIRSKQI